MQKPRARVVSHKSDRSRVSRNYRGSVSLDLIERIRRKNGLLMNMTYRIVEVVDRRVKGLDNAEGVLVVK
jgi:hypothetical protein